MKNLTKRLFFSTSTKTVPINSPYKGNLNTMEIDDEYGMEDFAASCNFLGLRG